VSKKYYYNLNEAERNKILNLISKIKFETPEVLLSVLFSAKAFDIALECFNRILDLKDQIQYRHDLLKVFHNSGQILPGVNLY
jgi:hypothetical protein